MMDWILKAFAALRPAPILPPHGTHDRRKTAAQSHHGYATRRRSLSAVTGVCLHQTGCHMGERPARYDGTGAHVVVTRGGQIVWLHDFDRRVIAANGFNDSTVSIEIDGLYAGVDGDPDTVWNNPATPQREVGQILTPESVTAACEAVRWIVAATGARQIVAHRQASGNRRSDPGSAIWQAVAIPMRDELGLVTPDVTIGTGKRIPEAWESRCKGVAY